MIWSQIKCKICHCFLEDPGRSNLSKSSKGEKILPKSIKSICCWRKDKLDSGETVERFSPKRRRQQVWSRETATGYWNTMGVLMSLYDGSAEHCISLYGIGVSLRPTDQHASETLASTPPFNLHINNSRFKTFFLFYVLYILLMSWDLWSQELYKCSTHTIASWFSRERG